MTQDKKYRRPRDEDRWNDIEIAIRILGDCTPKDMRMDIDFSGFDLCGLNLSGMRLSGAELYRADLTRVDLINTHLEQAVLTGADLTNAYLLNTNLTNAHLANANLTNADLNRADLTGANLRGALLIGADLDDTNLTFTDLTSADLDNVENLTQDQLDTSIYRENHPPNNLPEGFTISKNRAYEMARTENGRYRRRFVRNGVWFKQPPLNPLLTRSR